MSWNTIPLKAFALPIICASHNQTQNLQGEASGNDWQLGVVKRPQVKVKVNFFKLPLKRV